MTTEINYIRLVYFLYENLKISPEAIPISLHRDFIADFKSLYKEKLKVFINQRGYVEHKSVVNKEFNNSEEISPEIYSETNLLTTIKNAEFFK